MHGRPPRASHHLPDSDQFFAMDNNVVREARKSCYLLWLLSLILLTTPQLLRAQAPAPAGATRQCQTKKSKDHYPRTGTAAADSTGQAKLFKHRLAYFKGSQT